MRIPGDGSRILCGASDVRRVPSGAAAALDGAAAQGTQGGAAVQGAEEGRCRLTLSNSS